MGVGVGVGVAVRVVGAEIVAEEEIASVALGLPEVEDVAVPVPPPFRAPPWEAVLRRVTVGSAAAVSMGVCVVNQEAPALSEAPDAVCTAETVNAPAVEVMEAEDDRDDRALRELTLEPLALLLAQLLVLGDTVPVELLQPLPLTEALWDTLLDARGLALVLGQGEAVPSRVALTDLLLLCVFAATEAEGEDESAAEVEGQLKAVKVPAAATVGVFEEL